ncbi:MAG: cob(I)yrinic acid a,c-diamide adenosyltransferase [Acidobacteriota bacterium]
MKIYTKTGDRGETGLFGGKRVRKDAVRIEAYGSVDETNSVIGTVLSLDVPARLRPMLAQVQNDLFVVGADLATPEDRPNMFIARTDPALSAKLERWIDELEEELPALTSFILPGGTPAAAQLHFARTVCRRAERHAVTLSREETVGDPVIVYLNRLSDFLFVAARYANHSAGEPETPWVSGRT